MARMVEFLNPKSQTIQLPTPEKTLIKIPGKSKIILPEWYINYCPKYLRVVRIIDNNGGGNLNINPVDSNKNSVKYKISNKKPDKTLKPNIKKQVELKAKLGSRNFQENAENKITKPKNKSQLTTNQLSNRNNTKRIVGVTSKGNHNRTYLEACQNNKYTISNNIGVGILSFNRLESLKRLINSIRRFTDLSKTTIFVSDESTDGNIKAWLKEQTDIVVMTNQENLGVAGNTNRLFKCLSRFKYGLILNDDVEILKKGWDDFYVNASNATNIHHFCYNQVGVYKHHKHKFSKNINGYNIITIDDKPHGAVLFYTNALFNRIGYFDEKFGMYGMEHVDWSIRASRTNIQPSGFNDVDGSHNYFKIHGEQSAVKNRTTHLAASRRLFDQVKNDNNRIFVDATNASDVPSISIIIPIRDIGRKDATQTVINSLRSQLFPNIEFIIVEQDSEAKVKNYPLNPIKYIFAQNKYAQQPFNKSMAFNAGVLNAKNDKIILHDADMICPSNYVHKIFSHLNNNDGVHIGSKVLYLTKDDTARVCKIGHVDQNAKCERVVVYFEGGSLACLKSTYFKCGAFNEVFEGYGMEDCDFFERLKYVSNFYNERSEDFIHLWHDRTEGWMECHKKNKQTYAQIKKQYSFESYISSLIRKNNTIYNRLDSI